MRTYLLLAAAEFRRYSTYRLAILAGVTTQSVFGFIRVSVLFAAISSAGGTLAGYNQQLASTYVWLGQALLAPIALFAWIDIAERVSSGEIAVDFARPVDLQLAWWARDLGRASFQLLARGLPPLFIGAVTIGLALPDSWSAYLGAAIYGAFFAMAGGLQFFLIDGPEFTSAFVYGGAYAGQLPGSVLITPIRILFTFVFPATVTAYLPSLLIMGLPGPRFLPAWLGWFAPVFAVWAWLLAWLAWRAGIRRFTGAGG